MKKIICLILALVMATTLCACDLEAPYREKILGTWYARLEDSDAQKQELFEYIELYDEEIAVVDAVLYTAKTVTFNDDKTYAFAEDPEGVKEYVKQFYREVFQDLYEGRAALKDCYETDISTLSEADFYQFYATLYGAESMDDLIDILGDGVYNYETIGEIESGTYSVNTKKITFDAEGTEDDGTTDYTVVGDSLTITYSDGVENYTRTAP